MKNPKSQIRNPKFFSRPGTAMMETVLILPFILAILMMVLYFGRGVVRVQEAQVMDRFEAWRRAAHARLLAPQAETDLYRYGPAGVPLGPAADDTNSNSELNQTFLGGQAATIGDLAAHDFPQDAPQGLVAAAATYSSNTGQVAQLFFQESSSQHTVNFVTSFTSDAGFVARFSGPISHFHTRPGQDLTFADGWRAIELDWQTVNGWGYDDMTPLDEDELDALRKTKLELSNDATGLERTVVSDTAGGGVVPRDEGYVVWQRTGPSASMHDAVRQVFFNTFDAAVQPLANSGNVVAKATQNAYTQEPSYRGPNLEY